MMMGHDSTNVLIGGKTSNSTRSSSDESGGDGASALNPSGTDTLDPIQGDFFRGVASGAASLDDDAFDKIEMDFDAIMANDLELDPLGKKTGNSDANSDVLFASDDKGIMSPDHSVLMNKAIMSLGLSPDGGSKKMGISSKLGDIGDEIEGFVLDDDDKNTDTNTSVPVVSSHGSISMNSLVISGSSKSSLTAAGLHNQQAPALMDGSDSSINQVFKLLPSGNSGGSNNSQSSIDKLLANSENSMDKLLSMDILDFDLDGSNNDNKGDGNDPQTSQTNLSMADLESMGGINSLSSLPSVAVGNITPTGSFLSNGASGAGTTGNHAAQVSISTENNQAPAPASSQTQKQQQHALMMQRQQQLFLKQQQQQQQHLQQQLQKQQQQQQQNNANVSSISSIVNNHLSQLPQASQLNQMAASNLEQEKMQLIRRLQEIERAGMNGGQQQQQQQQLLFHQQQLLLQQQQKQQQQLQQRGLVVTNQPMKGNPQQLQGQQQQQHQTTPFSMNVQLQQPSGMAQADMLSQSSMAVAPSPTPFSGTALNDSNTATSEALRKQLQQSSSMFAANNSVINNANSPMNSSNVSSVMGSSVKETPLQSFLRNKRSSGGSSSGTPSMASQGQQRQTTSSAMVADNVSDTKNTGSGKSTFSSILDAKPLDFSSVSNNPFLRKQMMVNMDRSVNSRGNTMRGRGRSSGLSSSIRQSMMQQIAPGRQSEAESSDFYQSAGIISRHASADHLMVPSRRGSIGAGAAKAQNRRFTLSRSNSSFGNLKKSKSNSKMRDLHKANSNRSLSSNDSAGSLLPVKRGNGVGGRGGFGAKHRLGSSGSIHLGSRRTQSTPYMIQGRSGSAAEAQQLRLQQQHEGSKQNDGWP